MKEIRIAIIGTGMISHRHMTVIKNLQKRGQAPVSYTHLDGIFKMLLSSRIYGSPDDIRD